MLISSNCISQTETFDIITYTPPKGFKKDLRNGVITYSNVNASSGSFCVIAIYASTASTGDPQKDFRKDWNELVVVPFKGEPDPKTETQSTPDGWKAVVGASLVKMDGVDVYIILTVFSGFGKTFSIRTSLNEQSYTAQVDALIENMKLDKTAKLHADNSSNDRALSQTNGVKGQFRLMAYTAPAGWSHQVFVDGIVFKPLDLPAGEHLAMQIMEPLIFSGTLEQAVKQSYDEAALMYNATKMYYAGGANYQKTEPKISFNGWEYMQAKGGVQVENGTPYKTELGLDLFVIKVNNRFERIAVLKSRPNCKLSRYYSTDRRAYGYAIEKFLFTLQFKDGRQPALQPGITKGSGIVGVWQGISLSVGPATQGERLGVRYKVFSPMFFSNGQAYFGPKFPTEGLDGFDSRVPAELYRRDWGTYTFSNGRGVLKMPYGDIPLRMEKDKLIITPNQTDHAFYSLPSVDGATFSGTYALSELNGQIPSITFTTDGKFTDNGAIKVLYHEYIDCINPGLTPGSGTYEVRNYSIMFKYTDGRKIKIAFLGAEYDLKRPSPSRLLMSFNEDAMIRQ